MGPVGAVASVPAENGDGIAGLHGDVLLPAGAGQDAGRIPFQLPVGYVAFRVLDVQEEVTMRVRPLNFGDDARDRYGLGAIVLGSKRMVREQDGGEGRQAGREP